MLQRSLPRLAVFYASTSDYYRNRILNEILCASVCFFRLSSSWSHLRFLCDVWKLLTTMFLAASITTPVSQRMRRQLWSQRRPGSPRNPQILPSMTLWARTSSGGRPCKPSAGVSKIGKYVPSLATPPSWSSPFYHLTPSTVSRLRECGIHLIFFLLHCWRVVVVGPI